MQIFICVDMIYNKIRELRLRLGLTQENLAHESGLARSSIQKIEAGAFVPSESSLATLLSALGLELAIVPCKLDEALLLNLGVPLAGETSSSRPPTLAALVREFRKATSMKLSEREREAFSACALALKSHFPSTWGKHFAARAFEAFADDELLRNGRILKLRRIAIDRLSRFL